LPRGSAIDFEITSNPICHLTIPGQKGLESLTYTDRTAAKDVDVDFALEGIVHHLGGNCPGGPATFASGTYAGTSTLKAEVEGMGIQFKVA
jgi:hypothetical protein